MYHIQLNNSINTHTHTRARACARTHTHTHIHARTHTRFFLTLVLTKFPWPDSAISIQDVFGTDFSRGIRKLFKNKKNRCI